MTIGWVSMNRVWAFSSAIDAIRSKKPREIFCANLVRLFGLFFVGEFLVKVGKSVSSVNVCAYIPQKHFSHMSR